MRRCVDVGLAAFVMHALIHLCQLFGERRKAMVKSIMKCIRGEVKQIEPNSMQLQQSIIIRPGRRNRNEAKDS